MVKKATDESVFQAKCLKFLKEDVGGVWYPITVTPPYMPVGMPDIIGCDTTGRFHAFETKTKKYKATDTQEEHLRRINLSGGVAMQIRNIDELRKLFNV